MRRGQSTRDDALVRMAPLASESDVLTAPEVEARFGISQDAANQALRRAALRGRLVRVATGGYRRPDGAR